MRIGVVSDTHDNMPNVEKIIDIFNGTGVDRVIHTGDISRVKTLTAMSRLKVPLFGVYGNNDQERTDLEQSAALNGFHFTDPPLEVEWCDRSILVVHDPRDLNRYLNHKHHLALFGHTHIKTIEFFANQLKFNPGECAGQLPNLNKVGIVNLHTLGVEMVYF
ncbi:MAG: YfcE family phosphodiesterase [Pseudomonadales bacterium]|jgi:hypothetical protein|nr:YfcE family phosphodiesterase [Pseudomonadales bacterium]MDP7360838.1 YfcE family phosphodiesterase [Pseudomonadales bacterium]MDP7594282.1 YfcE family phosphodiesterase [Pseudomonadales bacterium]HJN51981.1 YfcE family phosphodiesterase [Pseudomonadales bacterium]|tara:strand:+ start:180 stop:665 length:486 start_codon:yes stop_codon:yes gene_type:complete